MNNHRHPWRWFVTACMINLVSATTRQNYSCGIQNKNRRNSVFALCGRGSKCGTKISFEQEQVHIHNLSACFFNGKQCSPGLTVCRAGWIITVVFCFARYQYTFSGYIHWYCGACCVRCLPGISILSVAVYTGTAVWGVCLVSVYFQWLYTLVLQWEVSAWYQYTFSGFIHWYCSERCLPGISILSVALYTGTAVPAVWGVCLVSVYFQWLYTLVLQWEVSAWYQYTFSGYIHWYCSERCLPGISILSVALYTGTAVPAVWGVCLVSVYFQWLYTLVLRWEVSAWYQYTFSGYIHWYCGACCVRRLPGISILSVALYTGTAVRGVCLVSVYFQWLYTLVLQWEVSAWYQHTFSGFIHWYCSERCLPGISIRSVALYTGTAVRGVCLVSVYFQWLYTLVLRWEVSAWYQYTFSGCIHWYCSAYLARHLTGISILSVALYTGTAVPT